MPGQTENDDRRSQPPMLLGQRADDAAGEPTERPSIESDGRYAKPNDEPPPDPRAVIEDLRRKLRAEQEKSLNAADAVMGARAAAAQAKAETQETYYRLHVRETELDQLKELLASGAGDDGAAADGGQLPNRIEQILGRPVRSVANLESGSGHEQSVAANASNTAKSLLAAAKRLVTE